MTKPSDSHRKSPKQERSKALVDSIIEATARILPSLGGGAITTKKIAELAGVSIGSLYQYFPNKESLLSEVIDKIAALRTAEFQKTIDEISDQSLEDAADAMIDLTLKNFLNEKEKTREIFRMAPELGRLPTLLRLRQSVVDRLAERFEARDPGRSHDFYVRTCFIAVNSVMGVVQTMLYDETQTYSPEALGVELKAMLRAYFAQVG